ncbi:hypothetical protein GMRT_14433 [Giardia muris]|uniref:Protein kinase domain-containing protein n=1 Tax=Giardia muris TaxID=5742 RepID=A0A4Z1SRJ4_GIAMU|nr:hypothetical protein GMRT_14433 [Giardia muris]|eukprot:TNJ27595.1 hypothetical protein GMRT_14433 [Giardia muris]
MKTRPPSVALRFFDDPIVLSPEVISGRAAENGCPAYGVCLPASPGLEDDAARLTHLIAGGIVHATAFYRLRNGSGAIRYYLLIIPRATADCMTLADLYLRSDGSPLSTDPSRLVGIASQLLGLLEACHQLGLVHGALDPANLYYSIQEGQVLLGPTRPFARPLEEIRRRTMLVEACDSCEVSETDVVQPPEVFLLDGRDVTNTTAGDIWMAGMTLVLISFGPTVLGRFTTRKNYSVDLVTFLIDLVGVPRRPGSLPLEKTAEARLVEAFKDVTPLLPAKYFPRRLNACLLALLEYAPERRPGAGLALEILGDVPPHFRTSRGPRALSPPTALLQRFAGRRLSLDVVRGPSEEESECLYGERDRQSSQSPASTERLNALRLLLDDPTYKLHRKRRTRPRSSPAEVHRASDVHLLARAAFKTDEEDPPLTKEEIAQVLLRHGRSEEEPQFAELRPVRSILSPRAHKVERCAVSQRLKEEETKLQSYSGLTDPLLTSFDGPVLARSHYQVVDMAIDRHDRRRRQLEQLGRTEQADQVEAQAQVCTVVLHRLSTPYKASLTIDAAVELRLRGRGDETLATGGQAGVRIPEPLEPNLSVPVQLHVRVYASPGVSNTSYGVFVGRLLLALRMRGGTCSALAFPLELDRNVGPRGPEWLASTNEVAAALVEIV